MKHDLSTLFDHIADRFHDIRLIGEIKLYAAGRVSENWYESDLEWYAPGMQKIGYPAEILRVAIGANIFDTDEGTPLRWVLLPENVVQEISEDQRPVALCVVRKYRISEVPE
jgi:hypothetical protein